MISEELKLVVKAEVGQAVRGIKQFQGEATRAKTGAAQLAGSVKNMALAFGAAYLSIQGLNKALHAAWDAAKLAAQANQVRGAFRNMAESMGEDADDIIDNMKKTSAGTLTELDIMKGAARAALFDIPLSDLDKLLGVARGAAIAMGEDVQYMFNSIITGIGRASPLILDNLGIIIDIGEANKAYAKSIGKTVEALTEQDRVQIVLNEVLRMGAANMEKMGGVSEELRDAEIFQKLAASAKNLATTLGDVILPSIRGVVERMTDVLIRVEGIAGGIKEARVEAEKLAQIQFGEHVSRTTFEMGELTGEIENLLSMSEISNQVRTKLLEIVRDENMTYKDALTAQIEIYDQAVARINTILGDFTKLNQLHPDEIAMLREMSTQYKIQLDTLKEQVGQTREHEKIIRKATGKNYYTEYTEKLRRLSMAIRDNKDEWLEWAPAYTTAMDRLEKGRGLWGEMKKEMEDTTDVIKENTIDLTSSFEDMFVAIGEAMVSGEEGMKQFAKAFVGLIAGMLESVGRAAIAEGIVKLALAGLLPGQAIAAGVAALVVAGALKAQANKMDEGGMLTEPVMGIGTRTGRRYSFAENRPEIVGHGGGGGGMTIIIQGNLVTEEEMYREADRWRSRAYRRY